MIDTYIALKYEKQLQLYNRDYTKLVQIHHILLHKYTPCTQL